jgi:hypothetical protein
MNHIRLDNRSFLHMGIPDHSEFAFGGNLPPFARNKIAERIGITYEGGKKGLGAIVSIAASIAIPFAAPAIATSLMGSMGIAATAFNTTVGSALVGAGLGAASSLITKQKMGQAALMGLIGGGTAGYMKGLDTITTGPAGANAGNVAANVDTTRIGIANLGDTSAVVTQGPAGGFYTQSGQLVNPSQIAYGGNIPTSALSDALSSPQAAANMLSSSGQLQTNLPTAFGGTADAFNMAGSGTAQFYNPATTAPEAFAAQAAPAYQQAGLAVTPQAQAAATQAPVAQTAQQPTSAWDAIKQRVTDPKMQADLVLRAAGQLAGSAMAGTGLSEEQQAMVDAQKAELAQLQQTNRALFEQRLNEATNLIGESKYFDPEYFGLQAQRGVTTNIARQKEEALRGISARDPRRAGLRSAEARRYNLEAATRGQTAYLQGADTAQSNKVRTAQAGLSALPTGGVNVMGSASDATQLLNRAEEQRRTALEQTGQLFGSITGNTASRSLG